MSTEVFAMFFFPVTFTIGITVTYLRTRLQKKAHVQNNVSTLQILQEVGGRAMSARDRLAFARKSFVEENA